MRKSKGFTLIEVLVSMACSTILIGGITACFLLMTNLISGITDDSANLYQMAAVRDYIVKEYSYAALKNTIDSFGSSSLVEVSADGDVSVASGTVVSNTQITAITFTEKDDLLFCNIAYNDGAAKTYSFVVDEITS